MISGTRLVGRFEIGRKLGQGSLGQVYAARDRVRQTDVALKLLGQLTPSAIAELKTEFRTASELVHPNLVRLHELFCDGSDWFFTMDLIEGKTLTERLSRGLDHEGLRDVVRQLTLGLAALHASGKLHRDLKPSNFLIADDDSRVVVLDFGLAHPIGQTAAGGFTGTPAYMAPEQYWGDTLGVAADWYALGVVLYEALTGHLPNRMPALTPLQNAPPDLADLCLALLNLDEKRRPRADEILERLAVEPTRATPSIEFSPGTQLINRSSELSLLEAALASTLTGQTKTILVGGPSGIGKTALIDHFVQQARRSGATVLQCRCRERESMSYKAIDGLVDDLVGMLEEMPAETASELLPAGSAELSLLFPALRSVSVVAQSSWSNFDSADRGLMRLRAIEAFAELLLKLRRRGPLILWVDDLQWSDAESALLLEPVLGGPSRVPLLFVGTFRDVSMAEVPPSVANLAATETPGGPLFHALGDRPRFAPAQPLVLQLEPLGPDDAELLARGILGTSTPEAAEQARNIARDSGGHPLFVKELAFIKALPERAPSATNPTSLAELIELRLSLLTPVARSVLQTLAVAGTPLSRGVLRRVRHLGSADSESALDHLRAARLARSMGLKDEDSVDIYHDRVREIVIAQLSREQRRHFHLELADTLEDRPSTLPEVLAFHLEAAEQRERAVERWIQAAKRAVEALAFDHAAQLLHRALQLVDDPARARDINVQRAEALAHAGKGPSAAEVYLALARDTKGDAEVDLRRLAAEQLLLSGHIERGIELMDQISRAVGMGATRHGKPALLSVAFGRILLRLRGLKYRIRPQAELAPTDRVQLEVAWTIACSLSLIDPINGARYHNEHMLLALRVGEPRHLLRALTLETSFGATGGSQSGARSTALIEAARHLMEVNGDHVSRGLFDLAQGIAAYLQGETEAALGHCDAALARFKEHCPGAVWETISATRFVIASLFCLGQYKRLGEVVPPLLASAEGTGNLYAGMCFRSAFSTVAWLVRDDPEEARRQLDHASSECSTGLFYLPHYNLLLGETFFDLYQGDPERAHRRWHERWSPLERSSLLRIGIVRAMALELRAASACYLASLLNLRGEAGKAERLLDEAAGYARKLKADRLRRHAGTGTLIEAAIHVQRGQHDAARSALAQAIERLDSAKLHMTAAAARMRLGNLTAHERGRALWLAGYRVFEREGVKQTERMLNLLAPGYPPSDTSTES